MELITVLHSSNITPTGGPAENPCIVNDQMGPFIVLYILIFTLGLPGSLLSVWGFIQSRRSQVGQQISSWSCDFHFSQWYSCCVSINTDYQLEPVWQILLITMDKYLVSIQKYDHFVLWFWDQSLPGRSSEHSSRRLDDHQDVFW